MCKFLLSVIFYFPPTTPFHSLLHFSYQVLNRSLINNFEFGDIQMHMLISLSIAWILVFFGVRKGIGSIGWAVMITATIPYLILIVLLLRGLSLQGASVGIYYFLYPDFRKLWSTEVRLCGWVVILDLDMEVGGETSVL